MASIAIGAECCQLHERPLKRSPLFPLAGNFHPHTGARKDQGTGYQRGGQGGYQEGYQEGVAKGGATSLKQECAIRRLVNRLLSLGRKIVQAKDIYTTVNIHRIEY